MQLSESLPTAKYDPAISGNNDFTTTEYSWAESQQMLMMALFGLMVLQTDVFHRPLISLPEPPLHSIDAEWVEVRAGDDEPIMYTLNLGADEPLYNTDSCASDILDFLKGYAKGEKGSLGADANTYVTSLLNYMQKFNSSVAETTFIMYP